MSGTTSEKAGVKDDRKSAATSSSSATGPILNPSPAAPASPSYYSPEVLGKSTDSIPSTRVDAIQRSLTEPATTNTNGSLDLKPSSMIFCSGRISPKKISHYADSGLVELISGRRSRPSSANDAEAINIEEVINDDTLSTVCLQEPVDATSKCRCPDNSRETDSRPSLAPSGEFVRDNSGFIAVRQVAPPVPSGNDISERREPLLGLLTEPGRVDERRPDNTVQSHRSGELSLATAVGIQDIVALESIDVFPDDVFIPEMISRSISDTACVKPETADVLIGGAGPAVIGECAVPEVKVEVKMTFTKKNRSAQRAQTSAERQHNR